MSLKNVKQQGSTTILFVAHAAARVIEPTIFSVLYSMKHAITD